MPYEIGGVPWILRNESISNTTLLIIKSIYNRVSDSVILPTQHLLEMKRFQCICIVILGQSEYNSAMYFSSFYEGNLFPEWYCEYSTSHHALRADSSDSERSAVFSKRHQNHAGGVEEKCHQQQNQFCLLNFPVRANSSHNNISIHQFHV